MRVVEDLSAKFKRSTWSKHTGNCKKVAGSKRMFLKRQASVEQELSQC